MVSADLIITTAAVVAAVLALAAVLWQAAKFVLRIAHFLDDWQGEEARPGQERRPGVLERLATVESDTRQLQRNGGSHLADRIVRIEEEIGTRSEMPGQLAAIQVQLAEHIAECRATAAQHQEASA